MPARSTFLIDPSTFLYAYPQSLPFRESDRRQIRCPPRKATSNHARADAVDQHGEDDDHAHQGLLPIGVDLREHEAVADHLKQHAADDGAERSARTASK